jgi:hypothetical protein
MTPPEVVARMAEIAGALVDRPACLRPLRVVAVRHETNGSFAVVWICCQTHNRTVIGWLFVWTRDEDDTASLADLRFSDRLGTRAIPFEAVPGLVADLARTYGHKALGIEP